MIKINEDYKSLVDLALDLKDFEWVKELSNKMINENKSVHNNEPVKKYIAYMDMNNNTPVYLDNNIAKIPLSNDDLNNQIVIATSIDNNKYIKKGDIVNIKYLSEEEQYTYKAYYTGWIQGYEVAYSFYNSKIEKLQTNITKLEEIIKGYKNLIAIYEKQSQEQKEHIENLIASKKWWKFWK